MMLLSGCKSKHSDYMPSSGLSSSDPLSAFLSAPDVSISLFGELAATVDSTGKGVIYHFQICTFSVSIGDEVRKDCINPFKDDRNRPVQFRRDDIARFLNINSSRSRYIFDQYFPSVNINYVVRDKDGTFSTLGYISMPEHRFSESEEITSFLKSKEEAFLSNTANIDFIKIASKISTKRLLRLARIINAYTQPGAMRSDEITFICLPFPSVGCLGEKEIKK